MKPPFEQRRAVIQGCYIQLFRNVGKKREVWQSVLPRLYADNPHEVKRAWENDAKILVTIH